ncbi:hypothetical protein [Micromonospora ureilytica]|uniref:hypothetical protein n=1 Tax=Micromonospora ureilytica TaxID=709868 RepID=UPI002E105381
MAEQLGLARDADGPPGGAECRVVRMDMVGDHTIVVGALEAVTAEDADPTPLLRGLGRYKVWPKSVT